MLGWTSIAESSFHSKKFKAFFPFKDSINKHLFLFCFGNCQDSNSDFNVIIGGNDISNAPDSVVVSTLNFN